jgi:hypothetical protein
LEASIAFRHVQESSRPPSVGIGSLLGGRGIGSRVGSWRGCLTWSFLGGDVFLLSLLAHSGVVTEAGWLGPREGSVCGFLMGPAFLGGQAFPERYAMLGEVFLSPKSSQKGGSASGALLLSLVTPCGVAPS